eukprot:1908835-Rhodomonas_salina.3
MARAVLRSGQRTLRCSRWAAATAPTRYHSLPADAPDSLCAYAPDSLSVYASDRLCAYAPDRSVSPECGSGGLRRARLSSSC